eukprot:1196303-Prorocentrum_minimum.AAC.7
MDQPSHAEVSEGGWRREGAKAGQGGSVRGWLEARGGGGAPTSIGFALHEKLSVFSLCRAGWYLSEVPAGAAHGAAR